MAPSMQITTDKVQVYEDFVTGDVRGVLKFNLNEVKIGCHTAEDPVRLTNVAVPTQASDAATKQYVDNAILGLSYKSPVVVVAVDPYDLSAIVAGTTSVDGVTLTVDARVLFVGQTNAVENGLYVVTASGVARSADLPVGASASGTYVFVDRGAVYQDRAFVCVTDRTSDLVGTNTLSWIQFSARPTAMAGRSLAVGQANKLDVQTDDDTITVTAQNQLRVVTQGITNTQIRDTTIENVKLVNPQLTVDTARGLLDGGLIQLGGSRTLRPDFTVVPDLDKATNTFTATTSSTSPTTGAVVVAGGVGIGGNVNAAGAATLGGTLAVNDTTQSTSTATGAVVLAGGLGVAKNVTVGGTATITGAVVASDTLHVNATTVATSQSTGALVVAGGLGVGGDIYASSTYMYSDARLKTDVVPLADALATVERLRGCTFTWNEEEVNRQRRGQPNVGVIAQEVQAVAPLCVAETHSGGYLAVDYTKLVPYLIESCKELSAQVRTLARRCDVLEMEGLPAAKRSRIEPLPPLPSE